MTPATLKTLLTLAAGVALAACLLPQARDYVPFLTALAGLLGGGAHMKRPGDLAETQADRVIEAAVSQKIDSE